MERESKARSARTGQERSARRPCDCEAKNLSRRKRATLGAQWLGVGAARWVGAKTDLACDTLVAQSKRERARGLKAGASKHSAAVLTTPTRMNGVRVRRR